MIFVTRITAQAARMFIQIFTVAGNATAEEVEKYMGTHRFRWLRQQKIYLFTYFHPYFYFPVPVHAIPRTLGSCDRKEDLVLYVVNDPAPMNNTISMPVKYMPFLFWNLRFRLQRGVHAQPNKQWYKSFQHPIRRAIQISKNPTIDSI